MMRLRWPDIVVFVASAMLITLITPLATTVGVAQSETRPGPYARIAVLRPHDGHTVDFEAGYIRHLAWHQQAKDTWVWYGWTVTFGDRYRWFVYATFGHAAADFDNAVLPAEDERDNVLNVAPHVEYVSNELYEFLPSLSRGTGIPQPTARLELTTVDLEPNAGTTATKTFESALAAIQPTLKDETLWYRKVAGGTVPRYVRLRPRLSLSAVLDSERNQTLSDNVDQLIAKMTIEVLTLRPTMSLGLESMRR
jgi:hypothetical protein